MRVVAVVEERRMAGAAKAMLELARAAKQAPGLEISIVTFARGEPQKDQPVLAAFESLGVSIDVLHEMDRYDRAVIRELKRTIQMRQADVVLTNSIKGHFLIRMADITGFCRWVAYHHGYTRTSWRTLLYNQLDRWSLRKAVRVATVCQAFARDLQKKGIAASRISVVPMPISPSAVGWSSGRIAARDHLQIPDNAFVFLCVGRLSSEKGQADLIQALSLVRQMRPDRAIRCLFVGDGPDSQRLEKLARELNVAELVTFAGHQNDVTVFYAAVDAFVLPSHSEGCPNVLLEALAAGLPVVATTAGGVPEFVTHEKDALLAPCGNVTALAHEATRLLDSESLRQHLSSSATAVVDRHRPDDYLRRMTRCFEDALAD